jgi:hypothetical protein
MDGYWKLFKKQVNYVKTKSKKEVGDHGHDFCRSQMDFSD